MSLIMEIRKCSACGKKYSFNPDAGKMVCPHCFGIGNMKKIPKRKVKKEGDFLNGRNI